MRKGFGFHDRHSPFRFDPLTFFAGASVPGALYDPSDLTTLFQDNNGLTPVTASGQSVGLMFDKSQQLALGGELITNGDFSNGLAGWINSSGGTGTASVTGSVLILTRGADSSNQGIVDQSFSTVAGTWYKVTATGGGAGIPRLFVGTSQGNTSLLAITGLLGTVTAYFVASGTTTWLRMNLAGNNSSVTFDDVTIKRVAGNHAYQIASASRPVYTAASGFSYLGFDGSNDSMLTSAINFTSTDKMTVWAGVTKSSDAAQGVVAELSATIASNNGAFLLSAPNSAAANYNWSSKGTTQVDNTVTTYTAPNTAVLTGQADIAAPSNIVRVNGAQAGSVATTQGTGNFGNYPLYIGRRNNATLPFNGRLYGLIVLGAAASDWQIQVTEQWMAGKTGLQF